MIFNKINGKINNYDNNLTVITLSIIKMLFYGSFTEQFYTI